MSAVRARPAAAANIRKACRFICFLPCWRLLPDLPFRIASNSPIRTPAEWQCHLTMLECDNRHRRLRRSHAGTDFMNNADLIVATLKAAGIDRGFGIPSGNVLPLMEAMRSGGIDFVLTAHEGSAGFAADVTGRMTGVPGLVHRHARSWRHQPRDRRRLRLARSLADDRHHLQPEHRPARAPHPDVDRSPRAVQADHQGDAAPANPGASARR